MPVAFKKVDIKDKPTRQLGIINFGVVRGQGILGDGTITLTHKGRIGFINYTNKGLTAITVRLLLDGEMPLQTKTIQPGTSEHFDILKNVLLDKDQTLKFENGKASDEALCYYETEE